MKSHLVTTIAFALVAGTALAESSNPAVKDPHPISTSVAAKGRNSFTESQARERIAKAGYSNITKLAKNPNGVWQGSATKDGQNVLIGLDYKGNVIKR